VSPEEGRRRSFEPWAWCAFALAGAALGLSVYLGLRPGGRGPVLAFTWGPLALGAAAALLLIGALAWALVRRPVLQRRRATPLAILAATLWFCSFPIAYPSSHEGHPSRVRFRLPFEGEWRVRWGGEERADNVLVLNPSRCFGFVFDGAPPDASVVAPCPGRVRAVSPLVLEVAPREYLVLEGLGTLDVAEGARVEPGDRLGALARAELTVHLEDAPRPGTGEGIPLLFRGFRADGRAVERGVPRRGQRVAPDPLAGRGDR